MTETKLRSILNDIQYRDWTVSLVRLNHNGPTVWGLRWYFTDPLTNEPQTSRAWYISPFSTQAEVVQTAFLAVKVAVEHETREGFMYRGVAIFHPHLPLDEIVERAQLEPERRIDQRKLTAS